jgi:hypothetical protein
MGISSRYNREDVGVLTFVRDLLSRLADVDWEASTNEEREGKEGIQAESEFNEIKSDHLEIHLAFIASSHFYAQNGRWPGTALDKDDENASLDVEEMHKFAAEVVKEMGGEKVWERFESVVEELFVSPLFFFPLTPVMRRSNEGKW